MKTPARYGLAGAADEPVTPPRAPDPGPSVRPGVRAAVAPGEADAPGLDATPPPAGASGRAPPEPLAMSPLVAAPDEGAAPCRATAGTTASSTAAAASDAARGARPGPPGPAARTTPRRTA